MGFQIGFLIGFLEGFLRFSWGFLAVFMVFLCLVSKECCLEVFKHIKASKKFPLYFFAFSEVVFFSRGFSGGLFFSVFFC